ncbi:MAG: nucleotidyltransferase family protein, partial [Prolixibacteraceae bacterium]|nr:nucleotidyltransferase family protein [Prolixibacteraceae bacterium]
MMNYKQCLFFVGKCLTLDQHPERIDEVKKTIKTGAVNWENVVKLSSGQFVLPALYLQLKRNRILLELPADLVKYLEEITDLNRKRNLAILEQAKEITSILYAHKISPVFLKGVAHLLAGLYTDIAERMIGDID